MRVLYAAGYFYRHGQQSAARDMSEDRGFFYDAVDRLKGSHKCVDVKGLLTEINITSCHYSHDGSVERPLRDLQPVLPDAAAYVQSGIADDLPVKIRKLTFKVL